MLLRISQRHISILDRPLFSCAYPAREPTVPRDLGTGDYPASPARRIIYVQRSVLRRLPRECSHERRRRHRRVSHWIPLRCDAGDAADEVKHVMASFIHHSDVSSGASASPVNPKTRPRRWDNGCRSGIRFFRRSIPTNPLEFFTQLVSSFRIELSQIIDSSQQMTSKIGMTSSVLRCRSMNDGVVQSCLQKIVLPATYILMLIQHKASRSLAHTLWHDSRFVMIDFKAFFHRNHGDISSKAIHAASKITIA